MKKVIFSVIFAVILMASCTNNQQQSIVKSDSTVIVQPELYFQKVKTVEDGNSVWKYSEDWYGTGLKWRDIIEDPANKFLKDGGRTWYNKSTNTWYCLIYSGENIVGPRQYVSVSDTVTVSSINGKQSSPATESNDDTIHWIIFAIMAGFVATYLVYSFMMKRLRQKKETLDPVKAGTPFCKEGVNTAQIHERMGEIVSAEFPGATYKIKRIVRGKMNGPAKVFYQGEEQPKEFVFNNIAGYEALVEINNTEEYVYCLQGCGNPIRQGNYFEAGKGFEFTPDVLVNEDGSEAPYREVNEEEEVVDKGSEFHQHVMEAFAVLADHMKGNDQKHKVSVDLTPVKLSFVVENKFPDRKNGAEQKPEKKKQEVSAN